MNEDHDGRQQGLGEVQLVSVGDVLLLEPSKAVRHKGLRTLWVWFGAEVADDEVYEGVGEVQEALQDVADALGASQTAQPGEQGIPPVLASLTDHLHLRVVVMKRLKVKVEASNSDQVVAALAALLLELLHLVHHLRRRHLIQIQNLSLI